MKASIVIWNKHSVSGILHGGCAMNTGILRFKGSCVVFSYGCTVFQKRFIAFPKEGWGQGWSAGVS